MTLRNRESNKTDKEKNNKKFMLIVYSKAPGLLSSGCNMLCHIYPQSLICPAEQEAKLNK